MKNVKFLSILGVFILLTLMISYNLWAAEQQPGSSSQNAPPSPYHKCFLTLNSISKTSGFTGTTFEMYGVFGSKQGVKMPAINSVNEEGDQDAALIVLSWSNTKLVVKVPSHLHPGPYKVGVYCSDPCKPGAITTYGMVWRNFQVLEKPQLQKTPVKYKK